MINFSKINNFIGNPPASMSGIQRIEQELKLSNIPEVYKDLLKFTNGFSIGGGLLIYGTLEITERNLTWGVDEYAKGYLAIGDDGGGSVFLMRLDSDSKDVYIVDSGDMNPNNKEKLTSNFNDWISEGCQNEIYPNETFIILPSQCDLILENIPTGNLKDLIVLKKAFCLETSIGELLKSSKDLPFVLVRDFPYGKAIKIIEKLGAIGEGIKLIPIDKHYK